MRVGAEDELIEPECKKGRADYIKSLGESPNQMRQLRVATHLFLQLGFHGLLLGRKLNITRVHIAENGQQQLICHIFQGHGDLAARKEEGMGNGAPSADQMMKIEQVSIVGQATR